MEIANASPLFLSLSIFLILSFLLFFYFTWLNGLLLLDFLSFFSFPTLQIFLWINFFIFFLNENSFFSSIKINREIELNH